MLVFSLRIFSTICDHFFVPVKAAFFKTTGALQCSSGKTHLTKKPFLEELNRNDGFEVDV